VEKYLLDPARLRKIPPPFSWIGQRLVRERHIKRLSHAAGAPLPVSAHCCQSEISSDTLSKK
jgi:hypothetical protein